MSNEYRIVERNDPPTLPPKTTCLFSDWTTKWTQISRVHPSQKGPGASLLVKMKKKKSCSFYVSLSYPRKNTRLLLWKSFRIISSLSLGYKMQRIKLAPDPSRKINLEFHRFHRLSLTSFSTLLQGDVQTRCRYCTAINHTMVKSEGVVKFIFKGIPAVAAVFWLNIPVFTK